MDIFTIWRNIGNHLNQERAWFQFWRIFIGQKNESDRETIRSNFFESFEDKYGLGSIKKVTGAFLMFSAEVSKYFEWKVKKELFYF